MNIDELVKKSLKKDIRAIAKLISIVENNNDNFEVLKKIYNLTGKSYYIGITGPSGVGKSSLVDKLIKIIRSENKTCAVLAVDPSSPFSGGAILGDRIRMVEHFNDRGVFIRSMGTRGSLGGLAKRTKDCAKILDAAGYDFIIFETVGVGQVEIDIAKWGDSVIVVLMPGIGDSIQIMKAGILEIADIIVINKADKDGADELSYELQTAFQLSENKRRWDIKIILTSATDNIGILEFWSAIKEHRNFFYENEIDIKKRKRIEEELKEVFIYHLEEQFKDRILEDKFNSCIERILNKQSDPYTEINLIFKS